MKINIFSLGQNKNNNLQVQEQEYLKRLTRFTKIELKEFKTEDKLLEFIKQNNFYLIGLEENGKIFNSPDFAKWLEKKIVSEQELVFLVADEAGFSALLKSKFNFILSLSPLTFPHEIARMLLCEQLYRSFTILNHHPYHKS